MSLKDEMFRFMMLNNMDQIVVFHNHLSGSVKQAVGELSKWEGVDELDRVYWSRVYEEEFPAKLRKTCFLMMFGHLEEMLVLLHKEDDGRLVELGKGSGIKKHKAHISYCLGGDLGESKDYQFLMEAQEVRNCLLHAAGRVSMMANAVSLQKIINGRGLFYTKNDRVEVSREALVVLRGSINQLLIAMHDSIIRRSV